MGVPLDIADDPLLAGFYSVSDAARLLRIDSVARIRGWLNGWPNSQSGPIIRRDFRDMPTVSFLDLMEMRFIEYFRGHKVPLQTLRRAAENARTTWKTSHPFALSKYKYLTDRRKIFEQSAEIEGDAYTLDLATNQYEMWVALEDAIARGVVFNAATALAEKWRPRIGDFPNIIVDPQFAFGRPIVGGHAVPTATLFSLYKAEGGNAGRLANWFNISKEDVLEAVQFEIEMAS